jgi:two-component system, cell cycle sensor histidine kinase and response regulator CckA
MEEIMRLAFFRSIRTHLLILVFIAALPALVIIFFEGWDRSRYEIERAKSDALQIVLNFSYDHERAMESARQFLISLAKVPDIQNLNAQASNNHLSKLLKQNPSYSTLFVVNDLGFVYATGLPPLPQTPFSVRERRYFQEVVRLKDFSVGEYAICPVVKRPVLHFAYPLIGADGRFIGAVVLSLDLDRYAKMFPMDRLPADSNLSVSDYKGIVLYRYPGKEDNIPKPEAADVYNKMSSQKTEGIFMYTDTDKILRLNAFKRFSLSEKDPPYLYIRVGIPEGKALFYARRTQLVMYIFLFTAVAGIMIVAWFLGGAVIVKRLRKLVDVSRSLGHGDLKVRTGLEYSTDELGGLAKTIDEMAEGFERKHAELYEAENDSKIIAEEWKITFDSITDSIMILDINFKIIRANKATIDFFKIPLERIIGASCFLFMHNEDRPFNECPFKRMMETKMHTETEIFEKGRGVWLEVSADPILNSTGDIIAVVHIAKDITNRKNSEQALHESENKFRHLAEKSIAGIYLIQDMSFKYVNDKYAEMLGYTTDEIIDKINPFDLIYPEDRHVLEENTRKRYIGEDPSSHLIFRHVKKDKSIITVETYSSRTIYEGKQAVIGTILDITDRKRAEEELKYEKMRFQTLVDNAPFGMILIDKDKKISYINPKFKELFGYDLADIPDAAALFVKAFLVLEFGERDDFKGINGSVDVMMVHPTQRSFTVKTKDGSKKEMNFISMQLSAGENFICCEDITERKRLEAQLFQSQKMEAIGTLAGGVAHDFNNLLMGILGYTSIMLLDIKKNDPNYERLKIIEGEVQSGANLTKQLLGFARGGKYELTTNSINDILEKSSDLFGRTKKEIKIYKKFADDLMNVDADRVQIEQVFLNIFLNAWQAMPNGGELYLDTSNFIVAEYQTGLTALPSGKYVKISITDTGIGMDEAIQRRVFEPFFTTKEMGMGTGLGLASAYGIIKNHGGTITVYSEKGKGTTFNIYLPASEKKPEDHKAIPKEVLMGTETILLVDDQDAIIDVGIAMLRTLGYTVLSAKDGKSALEIFNNNKEKINLVILDMIMPVMSGADTYEALKNINPDIKVILSSGYSMEEQALHILERGCNGFIQKPFNLSDLSRKIREIID